MDPGQGPRRLDDSLDGLDIRDGPFNEQRAVQPAFDGSPTFSELSLDEKLRRVGRPLKTLPRRSSNRRSSVPDLKQFPNTRNLTAAGVQSQSAGHLHRHGNDRQVPPTEADIANLSGNSHPSPATPTHIPAFYQPETAKEAPPSIGATLADQLSEAVLRVKLDNHDESTADSAERLQVSDADADGGRFKFKDLPPSIFNQGYYYRQRMAQIVLSCTDEAKAAHFAAMSRYYIKPSDNSAHPPVPRSPELAKSQAAAVSTASGDECCAEESDGCEECDAEFAWLENTGNKKKRKSARSSGGAEVAATGAKYATSTTKDDDAVRSAIQQGSTSCSDQCAEARKEATDASKEGVKVPTRWRLPKVRIPYSCRTRAIQRARLRAYFGRIRASRAKVRADEAAQKAEAEAQEIADEAERQARVAAEKKPQKRPTKAERKAQARRGGAGAPRPMSIAAIKARNEQSSAPARTSPTHAAHETEGPSGDGNAADAKTKSAGSVPTSVANVAGSADRPKGDKVDSEDEVELLLGSEVLDGTTKLELPQSAFDFHVKSSISDSLQALRASMSAVSLQLNDSLGPLNGSLANAVNGAAAKNDADIASTPSLDPHQVATPPMPRPLPSSVPREIPSREPGTRLAPAPGPATSAHHSVPSKASAVRNTQVSPSSAVSAVKARPATTSATPPAPPMHSPPPKLTRRKKATMNNVHHRTNYIPSRMPSDGPRQLHRGGSEKEQPPGLDHPSTTCGLFDGEWMCVFCEYELLYGEPPLMFRACKSRKKILANRKRAQARARRAAEGGPVKVPGSHAHSDHHRHHHDHYNDDLGSSVRTTRKKGSADRNGSRSGLAAHTHQRERCSCGNSIHDSDDASSTYSHSAPVSPAMDRSKSASRDDGAHSHNDGDNHGDPLRSPSIEQRAGQTASAAMSTNMGTAARKGKATSPVGGFDVDAYASMFEALAKDRASQTALARYIASGGRTTPPPVMMPAQ